MKVNLTFQVLVILLISGLGISAAAQDRSGIKNKDHSLSINQHPVTRTFGQQPIALDERSTTITHSASQTILPGNSVSCNASGLHTNNSYFRSFVLSDHGISGGFSVTSVSFGVEEASSTGGTQPITCNLFTTSSPFPTGYPGALTLIGTASVNIPDQTLSIFNIPVTGFAPPGSQLVVEIFAPNGQATGASFFIGSNNLGQTGPSYIMAADCGISAPMSTASIGFPDMMLVMNVTGDEGAPIGPGPATNPFPDNFANGVSAPNLTLTWTNPAAATSIAVYFGPDAATLTLIYSGAPTSASGLGGLSYYTNYYWRVDETNSTGTTTGPLWTFKTMFDPAGAAVPYYQTFNDPTFPVYWTENSTLTPKWSVQNTSVAGGDPNELMATWGSGVGTTRMILGPLNTTGLTFLNLGFKHMYDDYGPGVTIKIQSSSNGGTWTDEAFSYASGGGNLGPALINVPIVNNLGSTTYIAWVIDGDHFQFDYWFLDNINVVSSPCLVNAPSNPSPANLAVNLPASGLNLAWTNGSGTTGVEVFFGTYWNPIKIYDGTAITSIALPDLMYYTDYTWWVICKNADCGVQGPTWAFTTMQCPAGIASNPTPPDGSTGLPITGTTLNWTNGAGATFIQLYFGPYGNLAPIYTGPPITSYSLGTLNYSSNYQWAIISSDPNCSLEGPIWTFSTMDDPTFVFYEPFTDFSCWSAIGPVGLTNWSLSTTNYAGGASLPEVQLSWTPGFIGISKLASCNITSQAGQTHTLKFRHFLDFFADPAPSVGVGISYDGGSTFTSLWEVIPTGNIGPELIEMSFSPVIATFQLVLYINGDSYNIDYWYVDDISISLPFSNDVGTASVDMGNYPPGSITPLATVKNFGQNTNSFSVQMTITGGYTSTKTVTSLAPGTTQQVSFDSWNAGIGNYIVNVCTQLAGDQNNSNDCTSKNIEINSTFWTDGSPELESTYLGSGVGYVSPGDAATGYLFSIGGNTSSGLGTECTKYNAATNAWSPINQLPEGRLVMATAVSGNFLYVIGGYNSSSVPQTSVFKYDISANNWVTVAPYPITISWCKAVTYNNRIYVAGGYDGLNATTAVYAYDPSTNTWLPCTPMPGARFGGAFSAAGNKLVYVAGADLNLLYSDVYVGTIAAADPYLINWTTMMNTYPGLPGTSISYSSNGILDARVNKTKTYPLPEALPYPAGTMFRFDGAPWGDGIIVAGGSSTPSWTPDNPNPCFVYKPETDTWIPQPNVPVPVIGPSLGSFNIGSTWKLILASGYDGTTVTDATQILTSDLGTTTFPLTVNILNGWNMVSIPGLHPTDQNVTTWWSGKDPSAGVYKFSGGYQPVTTAEPGKGYWLKHIGAKTYNSGDEWPLINTITHEPIPAFNGWNLFGGYETSVAATALTTTPPGLISGQVFKYSGGYQTALTIEPGYGYWVKLTAAGSINIPSAGDLSKAAAGISTEDFGKIIITDASQKNYTLYTVTGEADLTQFDLPPYPPQGMFDIRYSSQRYAEKLSNTPQELEMTGLQYPVKVRAEGTGIILSDETGREIARLRNGEETEIYSSGKLFISDNVIPTVYALEQNYPNPFNPGTTIQFSIPEDVQNVKLIVYSALGEKVAELINTGLQAGVHKINWDASNISSGMYIYQIITEKFKSTKKMMLLK